MRRSDSQSSLRVSQKRLSAEFTIRSCQRAVDSGIVGCGVRRNNSQSSLGVDQKSLSTELSIGFRYSPDNSPVISSGGILRASCGRR